MFDKRLHPTTISQYETYWWLVSWNGGG